MRLLRSLIFSVIVGLLALPALAAETIPFDQDRFASAQKEGRPILIDITASWCPTCAAQRLILEHLAAKPEFKNLIVFEVDFDKQKDVVRQMHAQVQSTLIAFKGAKETARSVGDTDEASIERVLRSTAS
jgi:thiol-disulfide isomerase/thioredoxin